MIPKIIHYCWFGGDPLPELAVKCINSWKKYLPDYEIKEWNESNFDLYCCDYVKEAYEEKKWAFVSDYARFWILYHYGGLYFDTDVEVIRPIYDLLAKGPFMGCEWHDQITDLYGINMSKACNPGLGLAVAPGLGLAVAPGLGLYEEILNDYEQDHFIMDERGSPLTVVERMTKILLKHGFRDTSEIQLVSDVYIYPPEYFCPLSYVTGQLTMTDNTRSIHHYVASWQNETEKKVTKIKQRYAMEGKAGCIAEKFETLPLRVKNKCEKLGVVGTVKFIGKKILKKA